MAGSSASLSFRLFGVDVSASRTIRQVGDTAERTSLRLAGMGKNAAGVSAVLGLLGAKYTAMAGAAANVAAALAQAAPAAGLLAPAALTGAQALFTLKLASDGVKASMAKFQPQLDSLKRAASGGIAPGLDKGMRSLMTNLPVVREGVRETAKAFGDLAQLGGAVFSGPGFRGDLKTIMSANTVAIRNFGMAGISMARSLVDVAVAASPAWQSVSRFTQSMAASAQAWIAGKRASGELQAAIERGVDRVTQFGQIFLNLGTTVVNVFRAINKGAGSFDLTTKLVQATAWLQRFTAAGSPAAAAITRFFTAVRSGSATAVRNIRMAGEAFVNAFQGGGITSDGWVGGVEKAGGAARGLADKVRKDLLPQLKLAGPAFVNAFKGEGVTSDGWIGIVERLGVNARQLVDFARKDLLPTLLKVGEFLVKDVLPPVLDIANAVRGVLLRAFSAAFSIIRNTVIPALQPLARILRDDVVPLVRQVAQWFSEHLIPAAQDLATRALKPLRGAFDSIRSAIDQNRPQLQQIFNIIKTLASFIVGTAAPVIGVVLGTAIRLAGQAISIAITIIGGLVRAISGIVRAVQVVIGWFGRLGSGAANAVITVTNWFRQLPGRIVGAVGNLGRILVGAGQAALRGLKNGAVTAWGTVGAWLRGIPHGIVTQVGNLGKTLYNAGLSVLQGFWDGLKHKWEQVKGFFKDITSWIPGNKGPESKDRALLMPAGLAIMAGLDAGLRKGWASPAGFLSGLGAQIGGPTVGLTGGSRVPLAGGGGGAPVVVHVTVLGSVQTERQLADSIRDRIVRAGKANGGRTGL